MYELSQKLKYHKLYSALLGYVSMSEEAHKLVELVGRHPILYD